MSAADFVMTPLLITNVSDKIAPRTQGRHILKRNLLNQCLNRGVVRKSSLLVTVTGNRT
jgi:hypothetical protein